MSLFLIFIGNPYILLNCSIFSIIHVVLSIKIVDQTVKLTLLIII